MKVRRLLAIVFIPSGLASAQTIEQATGYASCYLNSVYAVPNLNVSVQVVFNDSQTTDQGPAYHYTAIGDNYQAGDWIGSVNNSLAAPTSASGGFTETSFVYSVANNTPNAQTITFKYYAELSAQANSNAPSSAVSSLAQVGFSNADETNTTQIDLPVNLIGAGTPSQSETTPKYTFTETLAANSSDTITAYATAQTYAEATPEPATLIPLGIGLIAMLRKRNLATRRHSATSLK